MNYENELKQIGKALATHKGKVDEITARYLADLNEVKTKAGRYKDEAAYISEGKETLIRRYSPEFRNVIEKTAEYCLDHLNLIDLEAVQNAYKVPDKDVAELLDFYTRFNLTIGKDEARYLLTACNGNMLAQRVVQEIGKKSNLPITVPTADELYFLKAKAEEDIKTALRYNPSGSQIFAELTRGQIPNAYPFRWRTMALESDGNGGTKPARQEIALLIQGHNIDELLTRFDDYAAQWDMQTVPSVRDILTSDAKKKDIEEAEAERAQMIAQNAEKALKGANTPELMEQAHELAQRSGAKPGSPDANYSDTMQQFTS